MWRIFFNLNIWRHVLPLPVLVFLTCFILFVVLNKNLTVYSEWVSEAVSLFIFLFYLFIAQAYSLLLKFIIRSLNCALKLICAFLFSAWCLFQYCLDMHVWVLPRHLKWCVVAITNVHYIFETNSVGCIFCKFFWTSPPFLYLHKTTLKTQPNQNPNITV